jgi:Ca2+-binding EF-hand superfamily protein
MQQIFIPNQILFFIKGKIHEDYLREILTTFGDRFTDDQVDDMYKEAPIKDGMFDYGEFTRILKHGAKDPDDK